MIQWISIYIYNIDFKWMFKQCDGHNHLLLSFGLIFDNIISDILFVHSCV